MKSVFDDIHYYLFGIFTGLALSGVVYLLLTESSVLTWIYTHDTLASGLLAFTAAVITVMYLHRQIIQAHELETNRRLAKLKAAKAALCHTLSYTNRYCQEAFRQCLQMARCTDFTPQLSVFSERCLDEIKESLELASICGNTAERDRLTGLMTELQILYARFEGATTGYNPKKFERQLNDREADEKLFSVQSDRENQPNWLYIQSAMESAIFCNLMAQELVLWSREGRMGLQNDVSLADRTSRIVHMFPDPLRHNPSECWPKLVQHLNENLAEA